MSAEKPEFWRVVTMSVAAFVICVIVIILAAKFSASIAASESKVDEDKVGKNLAPPGKIFFRQP